MLERARSFSEVFGEELKEIAASRKVRRPSLNPSGGANSVLQRAHDAQLIGLALSGGGIRSAIFNLGVLQALTRHGWLHLFDYISTVSGGGYIGSWIVAWIRRCCLDGVEGHLRRGRSLSSSPSEIAPLHFLREYGNYLTPRLGIFGADTWTIVAAYLRNLALNLVILLLVICAVLLLPRLLRAGYEAAGSHWDLAMPLGFVLPMLLAITTLTLNVSDLFGRTPDGDRKVPFYATTFWTWIFALVPILISAWVLSAIFSASYKTNQPELPLWIWIGGFAILYCALWLVALLIRYSWIVVMAAKSSLTIPWQWKGFGRRIQEKKSGVLWLLTGALAAGGVGGVLLYVFALALTRYPSLSSSDGYAFGPVIVLAAFSFVLIIHIGIAGDGFSEEAHEWLSRIVASKTLIALLWCALFGTFRLGQELAKPPRHWLLWVSLVFLAWVIAILLRVGTSRSSRSETVHSNFFLDALARFGPPVFVLGLLIGIAVVQEIVEEEIVEKLYAEQTAAVSAILLLSFSATALFLSWRVGINRFSLHTLYRNRLVRCFLGASNVSRTGHPFTDFDPRDDDVQLADLRTDNTRPPYKQPYIGPYPIINTAMNLVASDNRAWQKRKAASFILTPQFCGFDVEMGHLLGLQEATGGLEANGYRPTRTDHIGLGYGGQLSLGTAMTISGAAASPNMGYHSSPAITCLMTIFNLRLGWWFGNPRSKAHWKQGGPTFGLFHLFRELFGKTDDTSNYIYLSDGGHFETLGIYELVKRRCRFIIATDATEDRNFKFGDLGNAIEKCRTDFGIDIEIDIEPIRKRDEHGQSSWHCAVGIIRYDRIDPAVPAGTLVYIKSSITGDEPTDVRRYAGQNSKFPHESTSNQWFDESQFESYRALGYHIVDSVLESVTDNQNGEPEPEKVFLQLRERWYPASSAIQESFTRHAATFDAICRQIRTDQRLRFLDAQLYPEWQKIVKDTSKPPPEQLWLPSTPEELQAGFHFCNQLIQLMENVYLDLKFDQECNHPDNRGWMNLFRHWAWSGMLRVTWAVSASIYGSRFQRFCETRLHLDLGEVQIRKLAPEAADPSALFKPTDLLSQAKNDGDLNFREDKLIRNFLRRHEQFDTDATTIYLLQLAIRDITQEKDVEPCICFTFGFALVVEDKILYVRVQDHLRKMGLARRALAKLLAHQPDIKLDLTEVPTDFVDKIEVERFNNLFQSVAYEYRPLARERSALLSRLRRRLDEIPGKTERSGLQPPEKKVDEKPNRGHTDGIKLSN